MNVFPDDVKEFKELYKKFFGITLSETEANIKLKALVVHLGNIYQPIRKGQVYYLKDVNENGNLDEPRTPASNS